MTVDHLFAIECVNSESIRSLVSDLEGECFDLGTLARGVARIIGDMCKDAKREDYPTLTVVHNILSDLERRLMVKGDFFSELKIVEATHQPVGTP